MDPRVSVVIRAFSHAAYVGEAIRSALDQSFHIHVQLNPLELAEHILCGGRTILKR